MRNRGARTSPVDDALGNVLDTILTTFQWRHHVRFRLLPVCDCSRRCDFRIIGVRYAHLGVVAPVTRNMLTRGTTLALLLRLHRCQRYVPEERQNHRTRQLPERTATINIDATVAVVLTRHLIAEHLFVEAIPLGGACVDDIGAGHSRLSADTYSAVRLVYFCLCR